MIYLKCIDEKDHELILCEYKDDEVISGNVIKILLEAKSECSADDESINDMFNDIPYSLGDYTFWFEHKR